MEAEKKESLSIQSVVRAMDILKFIGRSGNSATLKAVSDELGLSHSTVHNILKTLKQGGFVLQTQPGTPYSLGYVLFDLYRQMTLNDSLLRSAKFEMDRLSSKYDESCNLGLLDKFEVLYIYNTECSHEIRLLPRPGMRNFAYCTACGKILLSALSEADLDYYLSNTILIPKTKFTITDPNLLKDTLKEIAQRGYAIDDRELSESSRCFGAPIYNPSGEIIAAMSLSFPDNRSNNYEDAAIIKDVIVTAAAISENNGYRSPYLVV